MSQLEMLDSGASLSDDGRYRFSLWRRWASGGRFLPFVMCNPSTADADNDDPTVRRCIGFAQRHGFNGLVVINLYALISTDPDGLWQVEDPIGPGNDEILSLVLSANAACSVPVVAAWGANARDDRVRWLLGQPGADALHSLGTTGFGAPKHPLARGKSRIPDDAPLVPWPAPQRPALVPDKPKAFKARCNLLRWVPEKKLDPTQLREAKEAELPRRYVELDSGRRTPGQARKGRWEIGYATCDGIETSDPAAFLRHMDQVHNRPLTWSKGYNEALTRSTRAGWRSPAMKPEGKPLPQTALELLRRCPTCDLHGEVEGNAGELWWDEHVRGCALANASAVAS